MNGFDIIHRVVDSLQFEDVLREELSRESTPEQKSIDTKMISTGSGTMENTGYMVPARISDQLNVYPNPERNGLILLFSYHIDRILSGSELAINQFIQHLYTIGEIEYRNVEQPAKVGRGRKRPEEDSDSSFISVDDIGLMEIKPEILSSISPTEYERLRRFVVECMLPGIKAFQRRWSAGVMYRSVNFRNFALNLFKGVREIRIVNQTL
jgi:hypothetical protein